MFNDYIRQLADEAYHLRASEAYSAAIDKYKVILGLLPDDRVFQMELGYTFLREGSNINAAIDWINRAIDGNTDVKNRAYGHVLMAECCVVQNNPKAMVTHMMMAEQLDPEENYRVRRGQLWEKLGEIDCAVDEYVAVRGWHVDAAYRSMVDDRGADAVRHYNMVLAMTTCIGELKEPGSSVVHVRFLRRTFDNAVMWDCAQVATGCARLLGQCVSNETPTSPMNWRLELD